MYRYYVSYSHANHQGQGFGSMTYTLDQPMTPDIVTAIQQDITEQFDGASVVVLWWQQFEQPTTASV